MGKKNIPPLTVLEDSEKTPKQQKKTCSADFLQAQSQLHMVPLCGILGPPFGRGRVNISLADFFNSLISNAGIDVKLTIYCLLHQFDVHKQNLSSIRPVLMAPK